MKCRYYKEQKQKQYIEGGDWIDMDEYRKGRLYESNSSICTIPPIYREIESEECIGVDRYKITSYQVSYDNGSTYETTGTDETMIEQYSKNCTEQGVYMGRSDYYTFFNTSSSSMDGGKIKYGSNMIIDISWLVSDAFKVDDVHYSIQDEYNNWGDWQIAERPSEGALTLYVNNAIRFKHKMPMDGDDVLADIMIRADIRTTDNTFGVMGNIASIIAGDDFYYYDGVWPYDMDFRYSNRITNAVNLWLPTREVYKKNSRYKNTYYAMFSGCTALQTPPLQLPATRVGEDAYLDMFQGCTKMTNAPIIWARYMEGTCFKRMFGGCQKMDIMARHLVNNNYVDLDTRGMYEDCRSIATVWPINITMTDNNIAGGFEGNAESMFYNCWSMKKSPVDTIEITATTFSSTWQDYGIFAYTFEGASGFTVGPKIIWHRAEGLTTTEAGAEFHYAFSGCASLNELTILTPNVDKITELSSFMLYTSNTYGNDRKIYMSPTTDKPTAQDGWKIYDYIENG